ncbi:MAG: peptidoglycan DL-endopeptidase CwlO [Streptomyces sp.]|nr:peptidoglycan DL-endopeptidase CwlO [Streptomyces sp.]
MATHRKPRNGILTAPGPRAAVGLTTAALATVTLFGESASAAPGTGSSTASIKKVQASVNKLYQQAEVATERYNAAKDKTDKQRTAADKLLDEVSRKTAKLNATRDQLGEFAAAQYRTGGLDATTTYLLASDPQQLLDNAHVMQQMSGRTEAALETFRTQQIEIAQERSKAVASLQKLDDSQQELSKQKLAVQKKLTTAQKLLNSLTAKEKARLAAIQKAADAAAVQKAAASSASTSTSTSTSTTSSGYAAKAAKAIAFAKSKLGVPYVYGATGPNSYDCSGLTQAAWAAAGVSIPRVASAQYSYGTKITAADLQPGDLVFFYSGISHVGLYIGGGEMIHAPHTGTVVKIAPISEMPIAGYARMA